MGICITTRAGGSDVALGDNDAEFVSGPAPPAGPTITSIDVDSDTQLTAHFTNPTTFDFYDMQVYADAGLTSLVSETNIANPPTTSWQHTEPGLSPSTPYWFRVRVSADGGSTFSTWSSVLSGTTAP